MLHLNDNLLLNTTPESEQERDTDNQQKQVAAAEKQIEWEDVLDELQFNNNPLPTAAPTRPDYEPDSQTIIVDTDWVRAVEPIVIGTNKETIVL